MDDMANSSVVGRLLEEISWEGRTVREYRGGGRGRENVLTAEVLSPLSYLPRDAFLGEVFRAAHGAPKARHQVAAEVEEAEITLLPNQTLLSPGGIVVQPDGLLVTPGCHVLIEAKGFGPSRFQKEQLAREFLVAMKDAGDRVPLLFLVLGSLPPVAVKGQGRRLDPIEAVLLHLERLYGQTEGTRVGLDVLVDKLPASLAWTTWHEIREVVVRQAAVLTDLTGSTAGTVRRLCEAVSTAIDWHSTRPGRSNAPVALHPPDGRPT